MARNPVLAEIVRQGRNKPRKHVKAAVETGIVESGMRNLPGGDADSAGWRQERASLYPDPTNVKASVRRFYREAAQHDRSGLKSWELAADVQRPAEQYRGRYKTQSRRAEELLAGADVGGGTLSPERVQTATETTFDDVGFEQAQKRAVLGQMIAKRRGTDSVLFRTGVLSTQQPDQGDFTTTRQTSKIVGGSSPLGAAAAHGAAGTAVQAAAARIGVGEQGSSNRGGRLDKWQAKFGMVGQPWCGIFVGISLKTAGVKVDSSVASVAAIEQNAKAGRGGFRGWGAPTDARPGDALVTRAGGHVGLVERVDRKRGVIYTIEGNTSNGRVERRTHRMDQVHGVARPNYGGGR